MAITSPGCGTLLHSERIGRPHSNDIDWKVAALDGLGLMLFFVPGVVAFVVDFYNGSIYLPQHSTADNKSSGQHSANDAGAKLAEDSELGLPGDSAAPFHRLTFRDKQLSKEQLEAVVGEQVGQPISLEPGQTRVSKLASLDRFSQQCKAHRRDSRFGMPLKEFFASRNRRQQVS